jgi:hypothetical protein
MSSIAKKATIASGIVLCFGLVVVVSPIKNHLRMKALGDEAHPNILRQKTSHPSSTTQESRTKRATRASISSAMLTPSQAREKMERARLIPNISQRAKECRDIISLLCGSGYDTEAWEMMTTDPGKVRNSEIDAYFRSVDLTFEQFSLKLDELSHKGESLQALGGYLSSKNLDEALALIEKKSEAMKQLPGVFPNDLKIAITGFLLNKLTGAEGNKNDPVKVVQLAVDLHNNQSLDDYGLAVVLQKDPTRDHFQKYQALAGAVANSGPDEQAATIRNELIRDMIFQNADQAMRSILSFQGEKGLHDLTTAINRYESIEPVRATQWFNENRASLSPQQQDAVSLGFFNVAMKESEQPGAESWLNQIQDPVIRKSATESLLKRFPPPKNQ